MLCLIFLFINDPSSLVAAAEEVTESVEVSSSDDVPIANEPQAIASGFVEPENISPGLPVLELFGSGNLYEKLPYGGKCMCNPGKLLSFYDA